MTSPRDAVVVGVWTTEQLRNSGRPGMSFALEALQGALADAGMALGDVEGLYQRTDGWPASSTHNPNYEYMNWSYQLNLPLRWATGAANAADTGAPALLDAAAAIAAGHIDTAAIVLGASPTSTGQGGPPQYTRAGYEFTSWTGSFTAVQFALIAQRHMYEYGTTAEQLAAVSAAIRSYGALNPSALRHGGGPVTVTDVLSSPMISEPLTRLMCTQVNDGGGALIVTTAERARDLRGDPIAVLGGADQNCYPAYAEAPLLVRQAGGAFPTAWVEEGFARSGIARSDVDVVELYDGFASWVLTQWEMLGFCGVGESGPFVEGGAMALDGPHPTCTDGGCHSWGDNGTPSLYRIIETVRQLRGEVPDHCPESLSGHHTYDPALCRAARTPEVGLAVTMGPPTGGGSFVLLGAA